MYQPVSQRKRGRTRGLSRFQTPGPVTGAMNRGLTAMAAKMTRREKRKTRKTKRNSRVPIVVPFKANTGQAVWGRSRTIHAIHEYEPHSGYGPYGRHNREYTWDELFRLPSANGFQVKTLFTADVRNDLSHPPHRIRRHQASGGMPGARPGEIHLLPEHCEPECKVAASGKTGVAV